MENLHSTLPFQGFVSTSSLIDFQEPSGLFGLNEFLGGYFPKRLAEESELKPLFDHCLKEALGLAKMKPFAMSLIARLTNLAVCTIENKGDSNNLSKTESEVSSKKIEELAKSLLANNHYDETLEVISRIKTPSIKDETLGFIFDSHIANKRWNEAEMVLSQFQNNEGDPGRFERLFDLYTSFETTTLDHLRRADFLALSFTSPEVRQQYFNKIALAYHYLGEAPNKYIPTLRALGLYKTPA